MFKKRKTYKIGYQDMPEKSQSVVKSTSFYYFYRKNSSMKYLLALLILFASATGCKPKVLTGKALESKLKSTMSNYLDSTLQPGVTFKIEDVVYYPQVNEKNYICQFHVQMHFKSKDTLGIVAATISNDFLKVERKQ